MRKKAKAQGGKKKLKMKDLPAGRKAGSVKGGATLSQGGTSMSRITKVGIMNPCN